MISALNSPPALEDGLLKNKNYRKAFTCSEFTVQGSRLKEPDRNSGGSHAKLPFSFENLERLQIILHKNLAEITRSLPL